MLWVNLSSTRSPVLWYPILTATGTNPTGMYNLGDHNQYIQESGLVICRFGWYAPSTFTLGTGSWRMSLPVQPVHSGGYNAIGEYYIFSSSVQAVFKFGTVCLHPTSQSTSTVEFANNYNDAGGNSFSMLPSGIPFSEGSLVLRGQVFYEGAM